MTYNLVTIKNLSLKFPSKICFKSFSTIIKHGDKIGIIGNNGTGKSSLLKLINNFQKYKINGEVDGEIVVPEEVNVGYIPQFIQNANESPLSGGENFNKLFFQQFSFNPSLLLLDEPTNHLDIHNRTQLIKLLQKYKNTLIVVSHNIELLANCVNTLWHIQDNTVNIFKGTYKNYTSMLQNQHAKISKELLILSKLKKEQHYALMQQEQLIAKKKQKGLKKIKNKQWLPVVADARINKAQKSQGNKLKDINNKKQYLIKQLKELNIPQNIKPNFNFYNPLKTNSKVILSIQNGSVGYKNKPVLSNINLSLSYGERMAITGNNGSGKSTLVQAILGKPQIIKSGVFLLPQKIDIGYLDQQYELLNSSQTILQSIEYICHTWSHHEVRKHLNDFLFRSNEVVNTTINNLSQGEKVRLTLCLIAAKTPNLLILDECSNNLDIETMNHVCSALCVYNGSLLIIDHDEQFLSNINITSYYNL